MKYAYYAVGLLFEILLAGSKKLLLLLLQQATSVATHMVKDFGMSDRVGLRTFEDNSGQLIGGGDSLSTSTKEAIDAEIKRLLQV